MTVADFDAEFDRLALEVEARRRAQRAASLAEAPADARLWLAVTPAWTLPLAEAADYPRGDAADLKSVFAALEAAGLCEVQVDSRASDRSRFRYSMPSAARAVVLAQLSSGPADGRRDVPAAIGTIGKRIHQAKLPGSSIPPLVCAWAELARHAPDLRAIGRALERKVDEYLHAEDGEGTARKRPDEALQWIEAARLLGEVLGSTVTAAIRHQERRVDLIYRQREDERHLTRFLPRHAPEAAFERLIAGSDDAWALHFVGGGGVGKTMLLRWITGRWAVQHGASVARVDFDYINPEFPSRAPGLLLSHLMQGLRLYADQATHRSFAGLEAKMLTLQERVRGGGPWMALADVDSPQVAELIEDFAAAMGHLPRPVVLLLDTCEELAKARLTNDGLPENVDATFRILEALHERVPWARVVFCGRRPLAGGGLGWSLPGTRYPRRAYLAVHEVLGFTRREAVSYLTRCAGVGAELVVPILDASTDPTAPMGFVRTGGEGPAAAPRYIPFGLSLYAGWAREAPELIAEAIRTGDTDPYIETRILGRVRRSALLELVPVLAAVGRVDVELLRAISTRSDAELEDAVRELREQDWVTQQDGGFFEVRPHLRERLWTHLRKHGRAITGEMRARAAAYLERSTVETPLSKLAISHFDAAARLLAPEPQRAFEWWERVERRFASSGELAWATRLVDFLLSEEGAAFGQSEHPLRPAVLATCACLRLHADSPTGLDAMWQEVEELRERDPRRQGARLLALRARAGRVGAALWAATPLTREVLAAFVEAADDPQLQPGDERAAAACLAGFEALVEMGEAGREDVNSVDWRPAVGAFLSALQRVEGSRAMVAFAAALAARAARLANDGPGARRAWKSALEDVGLLPAGKLLAALDWRPPEDVAARVRLELARGAHPALYSPSAVLRRLRLKIAPPKSVDADRLAAAVLLLRGATRPPITHDIPDVAVAAADRVNAVERYNAHRAVPPLFVAYWEAGALAYGAVDAAMQALRAEFGSLEMAASAFSTTQALERSRLVIARRMRLRDEERISLPPLTSVDDAATLDALHGVLAFDAQVRPGERVPPTVDGETPDDRTMRLHRFWRTIPAASASDARFAVEWAKSVLPAGPMSDEVSPSFRLDLIEASRIAERERIGPPFDVLDVRDVARLALRWKGAKPLEVEVHLRLSLRLGALGYRDARAIAETGRLVEACGERFAAAVAHDEGELLALRLPDAGCWILALAHDWFHSSRDHVGALTAAACRALAAIRADDGLELDVALADAHEAYDLARSQGPDSLHLFEQPIRALPDWAQLERIAQHPTLESLIDLPEVDWRPWLVRLIAALAWQGDGHRLGERSAVVGGWITERYGVSDAEAEDGRRLPPELTPWQPRRLPDLSVAPPPAGPDERTVTVVVEGRRVRTRVLRVLLHAGPDTSRVADPRDVFELVGELDLAERYREAAERYVSEDVWPWVHSLPRTSGRIDLKVAAEVASGCWEALIYSWIGRVWPLRDQRDSGYWQLPPRFVRRAAKTRGTRSPGMLGEAPRVRSLIGEPYLARAMSAVWATPLGARGGQHDWDESFATAPNRRLAAAEQPRVVHVVGWPITTGHGDIALQLDTAGSDGAATVSTSDSLERGGTLVRAADLHEQFPAATTLVLHAKPTFGGQRTLADQECACLLRSFAAELAAIGLPCVITIPPMPVDDSLRCLEQLAGRMLSDSDNPRRRMLDAVEDARAAVREAASMEPQDRSDAAWDICLYLS